MGKRDRAHSRLTKWAKQAFPSINIYQSESENQVLGFLRLSEHSNQSQVVVVYHRLLPIQEGKASEFAAAIEPLVRVFKEKVVLCPWLGFGPPANLCERPSGAEYTFVYPEFVGTVSYYSYALAYLVLSGRKVEGIGVVEFLRANPGRFKEVMLRNARDPQFPRPRFHILGKVWLAIKPEKSSCVF